MDEGMEIVRCKYCGGYEYWGEIRWLNGRNLCRSCYKKAYRKEYGKKYRGGDLDGPRPRAEDYMNQEMSRA